MSSHIPADSAFSPNNIKTIDGIARMRDLDLGEALGFDRPRNVRKLIQTHRNILETLEATNLLQVEQTPKVGRPSREYWLSKKQCLYICAKSDTDLAAMITIRMVEVFDAVTGTTVSADAPVRPAVPNFTARQTANKIAYWQSRAYEAEQQLRGLGCEGYTSPLITRDDLVAAFRAVRDQQVGAAVKNELSRMLGVEK